ncbi:MAG TPA: enoyl-CoA hydratase/isomerase family protein [Novosphingobium sp.]|nr:enoyl-CoA hydratase/isomerase family protein [Novosphingobium sp.]
MSDLLIEREGAVAIVIFNQPARRNAMTLAMLRDLAAGLRGFEEEEGLLAVILTGAGTQAFGAGLDIREAATLSQEEHAEQHRLYEECQRRLAAFPRPLIAAIEGVAAGGSLQMALHCDLLVVAEGARIGMPELSAGRPCILGSFLLMQRLGAGAAARLVLGQDWLTAQEAAACGLATRVVAAGEALEAARSYAQKLAGTAPAALRATLDWLRQLRVRPGATLDDAMRHAEQVLPALATSQEALAAGARLAERGHA